VPACVSLPVIATWYSLGFDFICADEVPNPKKKIQVRKKVIFILINLMP